MTKDRLHLRSIDGGLAGQSVNHRTPRDGNATQGVRLVDATSPAECPLDKWDASFERRQEAPPVKAVHLLIAFDNAQDRFSNAQDAEIDPPQGQEQLVYITQEEEGSIKQHFIIGSRNDHITEVERFKRNGDIQLLTILDPTIEFEDQWPDKCEDSDPIDTDAFPIIPEQIQLWLDGKTELLHPEEKSGFNPVETFGKLLPPFMR